MVIKKGFISMLLLLISLLSACKLELVNVVSFSYSNHNVSLPLKTADFAELPDENYIEPITYLNVKEKKPL